MTPLQGAAETGGSVATITREGLAAVFDGYLDAAQDFYPTELEVEPTLLGADPGGIARDMSHGLSL